MRNGLLAITLSVVGALLAPYLARTQEPAAAVSPHVIEVIAKTFEFTPKEIHVKAGERVQIKLRSADRAHGLKLTLYPEGASEDGSPGLVFEHPQDEAKVDKHHDRVIEFVAARRAPTISNVRCSAAWATDMTA